MTVNTLFNPIASLRGRATAGFALLLLAPIILLMMWQEWFHQKALQHETVSAIQTAKMFYRTTLENRRISLRTTLQLLRVNQQLRQVFLAVVHNPDARGELLQIAQPIFDHLRQHNITHLYFHGLDQRVVLRAHQPKRYGDLIQRQSMRQAVSTQAIASAIELGPLGTMTLRVVAPWYDQGKLIGYLEVGEEINKLLMTLHQIPHMDVITLMSKRHIQRLPWEQGQVMLGRTPNWSLLQNFVVVASSIEKPSASLLTHLMTANQRAIVSVASVEEGKQHYQLTAIPIGTSDAKHGAQAILRYDLTVFDAKQRKELRQEIVLILIASAIILIAFWWLIGRMEQELHRKQRQKKKWQHAHAATLKTHNQQLNSQQLLLQQELDALQAAHMANLNIMQDLMEEKARAEQALQTKSRFLSMMSHEIRTPLNGILGLSTMLLENKESYSATQYHMLQTIHISGHTLMTILNDVLDYSKMEANALSLHYQPFSLAQLIEYVISLYTVQAQDKNLVFTADPLPTLTHALLGDIDRLRQVLMNLVNNAIKFTEHGEVVLACNIIEQTDDAVTLRFSVTDSGIGMDKEEQSWLLEEFTQADDRLTRQYGGTGLGLAIVTRLLSMMESALVVESEKGKGTAFSFEITLKQGAPIAELVDNVEHSVVKMQGASEMHLLLVEDVATNQLIMLALLAKLGFSQIDVAENGTEAVTMQQHSGYDLILMDIQMPKMDGLEATRHIRQWEQQEQRLPVPIVALTAHAFAESRQQALAAGMNDYLVKPIEVRAVVTAIQRLLPHLKQNSSTTPLAPVKNKLIANVDSVIDTNVLQSLYNDLEESLPEIIDSYCNELTSQLQQIAQACVADDRAAVRRCAHRLKGSSSHLGALDFSAMVAALEQQAEQGQLPNREQLEILQRAAEAVRQALTTDWVRQLQ